MHRFVSCFACLFIASTTISLAASTDSQTDIAQQIYDHAKPMLVAVQYTLAQEEGRHELTFPGIVVSEDGLVMFPMAAVNEQFPDEQLKDFKIIIPKDDGDPEELDAVFQGRDERTLVAFVKAKESRKWTPIHFEEASPKIGETIYSVGLLPKPAGYHPYLMRAMVSAYLRGEIKQILVGDGGLSATGSPVFSADGKAIGFANAQSSSLLLNDVKNVIVTLLDPPKLITPTPEFSQSLSDPPTPDHPLQLAWMGVPELNGLKKEEAEYFGLTNQPAVQIGGIITGTPVEKAGIQQGDIIVKFNGQPLERGDEPDELPMILRRQLIRLKPGTVVTLSILRGKAQPLKDIQVTLEARPKPPNLAERYWDEELGFGVREMVFIDAYALKLKPDTKGVVLTVVKQDSSAATGHLRIGDLITQLNGQPVTDLNSFKSAYQDFRKSHAHDAVVMVVRREGRAETIRIEPPQ